MTQPTRELTRDEWHAEGLRRFGPDIDSWRFVCPSCGHVAAVRDWRAAGAPDSAVAFSCIGCWAAAAPGATFGQKGGPCNYAGGGLFRPNPVRVTTVHAVFEFAESAREGEGETPAGGRDAHNDSAAEPAKGER